MANAHLRLKPEIFAQHHARVATALADTCNYFAQYWLLSLASPTGNDILQEVAVEATGRVNSTDKLGADSTDGELEAKPFRRTYTAHISDDTPRSLLRHHAIPYIILMQASPDGRQIQWALLTSYRIFDDARFTKMGGNDCLPADLTERKEALLRLEAARSAGVYVRSNPLPLECLETLGVGKYDVWINPEITTFPNTRAWQIVRRLAEESTGEGISPEYAEELAAMRTIA